MKILLGKNMKMFLNDENKYVNSKNRTVMEKYHELQET